MKTECKFVEKIINVACNYSVYSVLITTISIFCKTAYSINMTGII